MGASCLDAQIDAVAFRCDVAVDECLSVFSVVANSLYVNLFLFFVPVNMCIECAHSSVLKQEVIDDNMTTSLQVAKESTQYSLTSSLTLETDGVEVYQTKHVLDVDILQVDVQGVLIAACGPSAPLEVLLLVADFEIVDVKPFLAVADEAGLDLPLGIAYCQT